MDCEEVNYNDIQEKINSGICPDCGNKIAHVEGCITCYFCGFSMCGA
ncbi:MAG: hypothetical protein ACYDDE_00750 [bacterium]